MYYLNFSFFTVFLKNRNISSKIKRSKVTEYAALTIFFTSHVFLKLLIYKYLILVMEEVHRIEMTLPLRKITSFSTASAQLSKLRRSFVKASGIGTCVFNCRNAAFRQS